MPSRAGPWTGACPPKVSDFAVRLIAGAERGAHPVIHRAGLRVVFNRARPAKDLPGLARPFVDCPAPVLRAQPEQVEARRGRPEIEPRITAAIRGTRADEVTRAGAVKEKISRTA